jgi:hypothetical protein
MGAALVWVEASAWWFAHGAGSIVPLHRPLPPWASTPAAPGRRAGALASASTVATAKNTGVYTGTKASRPTTTVNGFSRAEGTAAKSSSVATGANPVARLGGTVTSNAFSFG